MAAIFNKNSNAQGELNLTLVDSDPAFGPHLELRANEEGGYKAALSFNEKEIMAVKQWCERMLSRPQYTFEGEDDIVERMLK